MCQMSLSVYIYRYVDLNPYESAHVLLNLLNELGGKDKMWGFTEDLSVLLNKSNKFDKIGPWLQDFILHMTLKSHLIIEFGIITSRFRHYKTRRFYRHQCITDPGNLHI